MTDGTAAGTGLVRDIRPGTGSSGPSGLVMLSQEDGSAIFTATDGVNGREIWVTDGTEAGTRLVRRYRRRIAGAVQHRFDDPADRRQGPLTAERRRVGRRTLGQRRNRRGHLPAPGHPFPEAAAASPATSRHSATARPYSGPRRQTVSSHGSRMERSRAPDDSMTARRTAGMSRPASSSPRSMSRRPTSASRRLPRTSSRATRASPTSPFRSASTLHGPKWSPWIGRSPAPVRSPRPARISPEGSCPRARSCSSRARPARSSPSSVAGDTDARRGRDVFSSPSPPLSRASWQTPRRHVFRKGSFRRMTLQWATITCGLGCTEVSKAMPAPGLHLHDHAR